MNDLTIMYITANRMPAHWMEFQLAHLMKAIGNAPIVSVSREPMDLGKNLIDSEPPCHWNIYVQMLRAAREAETPFVAMAEDDVLYTKEHFSEFRPPMDTVSYDRSRWSLFVWDTIYCVRQRISNCSLIAPREMLIEALSERLEKWPNGCPDSLVGEVGRDKVDRRMHVSRRKCVEWYASNPIVQLNHPTGTDPAQRKQMKTHGQIKAYDIPFWGKATDIAGIYRNGH